MNNIKKIGMTALAASLVSTSVFAGELTATGSASITVEGYSGSTLQSNTAYSMGDSVVLSGSTELDNGMTVSMSFELDSDNQSTSSSYDDESVTISSDALGTIKFSGHGGSSATSAIDATAAGNIYDNFDGTAGDGSGNGLTSNGLNLLAAAAGDNNIYYTLPAMVDGLAVNASLNTAGATGNNALGFNMTYTGVEGLSVSYGQADINTGVSTTEGDQTVMNASYAYGPVTVSYTNSDYDTGAANTRALAQEVTSYAVSYTVSDAISLTYGTETIESGLASEVTDAEYEGITASYTAGGMTISLTSQDAENIDHGTNADEDYEYWALGLAFAF
jgi:outer membrane protein OmpU